MADKWDFAAEFEAAPTGHGTSYLPGDVGQRFIEYVDSRGAWVQSMEAFECEGGVEICDLQRSIKRLTTEEKLASVRAFNQIARERISDALRGENPYIFKIWIDL